MSKMTEAALTVTDEPQITQDFPVKNLGDRYSIGRSTAYARLKQLRIDPIKRAAKIGSTEALLNADQMALMDKYDLLANQDKAKLEEWLSELDANASPRALDNGFNAPNGLMEVLMAIAQRLPAPEATLLQSSSTLKERLETLQAACDNDWLLSTRDIKELIGGGLSPPERYGFRFEKAGRNGRAIAWRVIKAD